MYDMVQCDDLNNEQTNKVAAAFLVKAQEKREEEIKIEEEGAGPKHPAPDSWDHSTAVCAQRWVIAGRMQQNPGQPN